MKSINGSQQRKEFKLRKIPELPSEGWVKEEIKKILDHFNIWWYMPNGGHFGKTGIPDFVCCYQGKFLAIEAKKGGGVWKKAQQDKAKEIKDDGHGTYIVVDEYGLKRLYEFLLNTHSHSGFIFSWEFGIFDFRGKTLNKETTNDKKC